MHHCSRCGNQTRLEGRHHACSCGHTDYTNPAPAVGVAILDGESVLLARRARPPKQGAWDLVGGFIEPDEDAKAAAAREVMEETGMTLGSVELVDVLAGDYDGRPTLNLLYIGQAGGEPTPADDVAELRWFTFDALPDLAWPHEAAALAQIRALMDAVRVQA